MSSIAFCNAFTVNPFPAAARRSPPPLTPLTSFALSPARKPRALAILHPRTLPSFRVQAIAEDEWESEKKTLKGVVGSVALAEDETTGADLLVSDLKKKLIDQLFGTDRGLKATSETRAEVNELITQLEAKNPNPAPTEALSLLNGKWILAYTSFAGLFPLLGAESLQQLLKVDEISQTIDSEGFTVQNSVRFVGPFSSTSVTTNAKFEVRSPKRVQKDPLQVKVNKLSSTKTQLPYSYYSLSYCKPDIIVDSAENLGEVLRGDRIENSPYTFYMREPQMCNIICKLTPNEKQVKEFREKIEDEYRVNMILDNLPLVVPLKRLDQDSSIVYQQGFHVGLKGQYAGSKEEKYFIHNHLSFRVKYHKDEQTDFARIVAFEVKPFSVKHAYEGNWNNEKTRLTTCDPHTKRTVSNSDNPQEVEENKDIIFTYDVEFQESETKWASRWDSYLLMSDDQIHWFSIVNSLMIVLFLSGMVAMIMLRTLYRDISKYNQLETQEEAQEETGWKLVHGDVFRPPTNSDLLCVYVGTGVQFFGMLLITIIFAVLGFLSPSNRGGLMSAMLLLWVFMGILAGYSSAQLHKKFKGSEWKKIAMRTAFMFPGIIFAIFFVLNAIIWGEKSSGAVPFTTMFALVLLWFGISVPLVFVGGYIGSKKPVPEDPVKTNKIPRQIPEQAWYMNPLFSILIGGILPFGAVFIELFFILTSIWLQQFYYLFGFLFLVFIILIVTCAEITIVLCYFQLCSEDYLWWWRSYLTSGSSALYLFLYATFYFFTKLEITKLVSGILYFGYMLIASYAFFVLTGTIGFYACFWFTRLIYSSVKID